MGCSVSHPSPEAIPDISNNYGAKRHELTLSPTVLLQGATLSLSAVQDEQQYVIGTNDARNGQGDAYGAEVAPAQNGGQFVQPGMDTWMKLDRQHGERIADRSAGADLVDSALVELQKLKSQHSFRLHKPTGVFGTLLNLALKAVPTLRLSAPTTEPSKSALSGPLLRATKLLEESSRQYNNSDALYLLAELNFYGNYSHPKNPSTAFNYYQKLATLNGNSSALYMLGMMYSTGVGGAVERDQARALLYYTFAANQGHTRAEMTVAHRHYVGIGTPKSCDVAVKYYKRVADKAIEWYRSGPPGGMNLSPEAYRIADEHGGVYGEGASAISSGQNAVKAGPNSDAYASIEDIIEYLDLYSKKGDYKATLNLGRIYYDGQKGLPRNLDLARKYFMTVAHQYWQGNRQADTGKPELTKYACKAAGYLGRMYLRGEGVSQDFGKARMWFMRGREGGDPQSLYGLGLIQLHGYGVDKNLVFANSLFVAAAQADWPDAQVQLGALYLDQGHADDVAIASQYFELAARYGNIEAYYYLGEMNNYGVGREKSCSTAVTFYKSVAERAEPVVSSWAEANLAYESGDSELAFLEYLSAAEQGYEKAQNNVAYMLDPEKSRLPVPQWLDRLDPRAQKSALLENPSLALIYWTRSAKQGNIDALVKMGDYYLYGIGADVDVDKAVQCYTGASEYQQSAQALYNLGWMHENGVGLTQDYHLAKRYYDSALETNDEAHLPVTLSLLKLRARSAWNTFTHGKINSIQDEPGMNHSFLLYFIPTAAFLRTGVGLTYRRI